MIETVAATDVFLIDIDRIEPNPLQPRRAFDESELQDLAKSIRVEGILHNLVVRRAPIREDGQERYFLHAGERRWRAARLAGLQQVPCKIKDTSKSRSGLIALTENDQRVDVSPLEEARIMQALIEDASKDGRKMTLKEIATARGRSVGYVQNRMDLLHFREDVQMMVERNRDTMSHARLLNTVIDGELRAQLIAETEEGASTRDIEARIKREKEREAWRRQADHAPDRETQSAQNRNATGGEVVSALEDSLVLAERALLETRALWPALSKKQQREYSSRLSRLRALAVEPADAVY
jgi:ParB family chromosome partitioning protein